ncbi:MAG: hypothetical protein ACPLQP_05940 [Moorellaceae bacterium]
MKRNVKKLSSGKTLPCLAIIAAVFLFFAPAILALAAETSTQDVTVTDPGGIKPVSPGEFVAKINSFIADLNAAISGIVLPLATFAMLVSIAVITVGFLVGHSNLKRYGWGGLFLACCGVFLFYGLPLIIGLVRALAYRLAG